MARSGLASSKAEPGEQPMLIVFSGGNNSRLGNVLGAYIELCMVCKRIGKRLVFPFAEDVIGRFFTFKTPSGNTDTVDQAKNALRQACPLGGRAAGAGRRRWLLSVHSRQGSQYDLRSTWAQSSVS